MSKVFDPIRATTEWREPLPPVEVARRGIRSIQNRRRETNTAAEL
jgi:hypothetical protein